ncbi:MAG TPA: tetratricopeptide repeat protein [Planctomycetota bacterium]|nr:tetratricopeptide repeat protein [Planctomycetota bacterium]
MRSAPLLALLLAVSSAFAADRTLSRELTDYLTKREAQTSVLDGALLICKEVYPDLDVDAERRAIVKLAAKLSAALANVKPIAKQAEVLAKFIFEEEKFTTPKKDDAEAFLLSDVMKNRRGNCLGLSVLCLALAEEAKFTLHPVPVPSRSGAGHMLVRFVEGTAIRNFDPGERGAERPNSYYEKEFKLTAADLKSGYVLSNAGKRDVLFTLLINLGGAHIEARRAADAVPLLKAALNMRADLPAAHSNLAAARLILGDTAAAEKSYNEALKLDPKFFPARLGKADIAFRKNDPGAEKLIADLAALEPDNLPVRTLQANLQLKRNDLDGAIKTLTAMSALPAADSTVFNNLGKCLAARGDIDKAEAAYRKAIERDEKNPDPHTELGKLLEALGRKDEAAVEFAAAKKLSEPENAGIVIGVKQPAEKPEYPEGTTTIPFRIFANRVFVPIRLNDKVDAEGLLDTGAEVSIINRARVKIDLPQVGSENLHGDMIGKLAVKTVSLASLSIGKVTPKKLSIGAVEQGAGTKFENVDFLLGMDVLGKWRFTLDFEHSLLVLWPEKSKLPPASAGIDRVQTGVVSPPAGAATRPFVLSTLNQKHTATFLIDTAADAPMFVAFQKPSDMGLATQPTASGAVTLHDGGKKMELSFYPATFATLSIGPKGIFNEVAGRVVDASAVKNSLTQQDLKFLNVIGLPFLKTLRALHVDMPAKTVWLDREK